VGANGVTVQNAGVAATREHQTDRRNTDKSEEGQRETDVAAEQRERLESRTALSTDSGVGGTPERSQ
jgi:hypothetical protein